MAGHAKNPCLPIGDRCLQDLDYFSFSKQKERGSLQRRVLLEVTQQSPVEGFQILTGSNRNFGRVRRRIGKSFYTLVDATTSLAFRRWFRPEYEWSVMS